jgi:hypothetical protein
MVFNEILRISEYFEGKLTLLREVHKMSKNNGFMPKDIEFENLVKKAKTRSIFKMIVISLIICLIVFPSMYFIGNSVMKLKIDKQSNMDLAWIRIIGANIEEDGTRFSYSPISATVTTKLVKKVDGVPIPWGEQEKVYSIFGGSKSVSSLESGGSGSILDERIPIYYHGERVVEFYHPQVNYKEIFDDRILLDQFDKNSVVEMALSFDKSYSIEEVDNIFKESIAWYWVDTFKDKDIDEQNENNKNKTNSRGHTISGHHAIGFKNYKHPNAKPAMDFISTLQLLESNGGKYKNKASKIIDNITDKKRLDLEPANIKVSGIVITGKPSTLKKITDRAIIRAATLGATTNKY